MRTADAAQVRQVAIEILLLWEGVVSNARLRELFRIHPTMASRDLASYRDTHEGQMEGPRGGQFAVTQWARPALTRGKFEEYARLIGASSAPPAGLAAAVPVELVAPGAPDIPVHVFRAIHQAMRQHVAVQIEYGSLAHPDRHPRTIFPHALAQAGARWHVRAYCALRKGYRDFNLGRVYAAELSRGASSADLPPDSSWAQEVALRFIPHVALTASQKRLVRDEYMGGTAGLVQTTRAALAPYLIHAYRAAVDPAVHRPPEYLLQVQAPQQLPRAALLNALDDTDDAT